MSALADYTHPRDKVSHWLQSGALIRVKKGLYVFGREFAESPYSKEVIANLIYGPSAVSLTYALSYYGLIPKSVSEITSITNSRHKLFETPVGRFSYCYLSPKHYSVGIELQQMNLEEQFFMASPEKALCDYIYLIDKLLKFDGPGAMEAYLVYDLHIDEGEFKRFRFNKLSEIVGAYGDERLILLKTLLKSKRNLR